MSKLYFPSVNMLRGIAALMVAIYHFTNYLTPKGMLLPEGNVVAKIGEFGAQGVFIFFVITGFVIPISLYQNNFRINKIFKYLYKRWVRIEIPYILSVVFVIIVSLIFSIKNDEAFNFDFLKFIYHIFYLVEFVGYDWYNIIYWTLAIEFQFYIVIAIIFPLLISENNIIKFTSILLFAFSSLIITDNSIVSHYTPIFSQGIVLFLIKTNKIKITWGGLLILIFTFLTYYTNGLAIAFFSLFAFFVIAFFNVNIKIFNKLGNISYSLYLIHGLVGGNIIYFLYRYIDNYYLKLLLILFAIFVSIISAYIYWKIVENPSKKISKKIEL